MLIFGGVCCDDLSSNELACLDSPCFLRAEAGHVPQDKQIAGFTYKGFLYESVETYAKLMESCGFTIVKQSQFMYHNTSTHFIDNEGMVIGKKIFVYQCGLYICMYRGWRKLNLNGGLRFEDNDFIKD